MAVLTVAGCGEQESDGSSQAAGPRASAPEEAVAAFARAAGHLGSDRAASRKRLGEACQLLSPDVRAAMQFQESAHESAANCADALSVSLYYPGDTGELAQPSALDVSVGGKKVTGRTAIVGVRVTYKTDEGRRSYRSKVMVTRSKGAWRWQPRRPWASSWRAKV